LAKLIVLIVIFAAAWWLLRRYLRALIAKGRADPASPPAAEAMVRCERCGVHLPRSECISRNEQVFCSEEHARLNG
jgi:uncharacterized protein